MKNSSTIKHLLNFFTQAEKMKTELRHSYTSNKNRQESNAEHSWMLCLITLTLFEHLQLKVDQLKVLKMLIIHDLAEAVTGDIPTWKSTDKKLKVKNERRAMTHLTKNLDLKIRKQFMSLWSEYEENKTIEAKLTQAIDKLEAPFQHNLAAISTWDQNDFDVHPFYKYDYSRIDPFLLAVRSEIETMSRKKITKAKALHRLKKDMRKEYEKLNMLS